MSKMAQVALDIEDLFYRGYSDEVIAKTINFDLDMVKAYTKKLTYALEAEFEIVL
jgi:hypothetical protein